MSAVLPALAPLLIGGPAAAADAATQAAPVVVTATRVETPIFEVPAAIDRVDGAQIRADRLQVNLTESLGAVAGLQARDRQNFAQDVQISVRGFGARSAFGIRGVRLYVDGIPATLPDGQGQLSNIDLASVDRIEVLRGPFSALYGNSSGGVIQAFTEEGRGPPTVVVSTAAGSDGARRAALKLSGQTGDGRGGDKGGLGYVVSTSGFETDGWRAHSAAERRLDNIRLDWRPGDASGGTRASDTRITLIANRVALPFAQDPLGLSRAQFNANPRGVDPAALTFDTRKTVAQTQLGLRAEQRLGDGGRAGSVQFTVYDGQRRTEQFQAIPLATQANPLHPGGVIQLARDYGGADLRWQLPLGPSELLPGRGGTLVAGVAHDRLREQRLGFQNFVGDTLGVAGALRRDEINRVANFDQYLQLHWTFSPALSLDAGLRHSRLGFRSADRYVGGGNPDDSGRLRLAATLPVAGLSYAITPALRVYGTVGRGFESPTLNELAYRADGDSGLNLALRPARSNNAELGLKARSAEWGEGALALYAVDTHDEIVTLGNVGGRATYTNAGRTSRRGWEASWSTVVFDALELHAALTRTDARYRDAFATCAATPCATPTVWIPAGNRIPGVARSVFHGTAAWAPALGWRAAVELRASSRVAVDDRNSDAAAGYAVVNVSAGYAFKLGRGEISLFTRLDNVFGRVYAGSVIVNEGNARFFEPAPRRTWLGGISATLRF
jgi:iron complex outermembrane receptor protein